jgi:hypothetical protein
MDAELSNLIRNSSLLANVRSQVGGPCVGGLVRQTLGAVDWRTNELFRDFPLAVGTVGDWGRPRIELIGILGAQTMPSLHLFLGVCFPVLPILASVLSVAIVVPVQLIEHKSVCSYPAHLFVDVLPKVGDVKNATTVVQARINQVLPEAFQQG